MVNPTRARLALAQTTTTDDFELNLRTAVAMVGQAADQGAQLLAFPEVFLYVGGRDGKFRHAQPLEGEVVSRFCELAAQHRMLLLLGSLHEPVPGNPDKLHNTSVLIGCDGRLLARYRKLKLFDVDLPTVKLRESDSILAGTEAPPVVATAIGRVGLTICFDLRFPELYRGLRARGAQIIFVPSNFTAQTGAAHWDLLLRARAVENQCFVAAPAQFGRHNDRYASWGHSALVDPWGSVVALAPDRTGLVFGDIDLDYLAQVRERLPMGEPPAADG